jgi:hypothetical protein
MVDVSVALTVEVGGEKVVLSSRDPISQIKTKGFAVKMPEGISLPLPSPANVGDDIGKAITHLLKVVNVDTASAAIPSLPDRADLPLPMQTVFAAFDKVSFSLDAMRLKVVPADDGSGGVKYTGLYDILIGAVYSGDEDLAIGPVKIVGVGFRLSNWPEE